MCVNFRCKTNNIRLKHAKGPRVLKSHHADLKVKRAVEEEINRSDHIDDLIQKPAGLIEPITIALGTT